jgi:hypothetical protein
MMLPFTLFQTSATAESETVHINPLAVSTVVDSSARKSGSAAWLPIAIITLLHGGTFTVHDPDRTAAASIAAAQAEEREAQL